MRKSALISLLRDPSRWPKDFQWQFMDCRQCAMGLYAQVYENRIVAEGTGLSERRYLQSVLGLTESQASSAFSFGGTYTTAADVAHTLEKFT